MAQEKFISRLDDLWVSEGFVNCVAEIYANTPAANDDGMRSAVIDSSLNHVQELLSKKAFSALVEEGGDFALDLVRALAESQKER